ncbi:MAG: MMPL family transporter [Gammaproteobacteria bacterium]|nr:MMPL family transporter [Gammaproteobacteria bacterium]
MIARLETLVFARRRAVVSIFVVVTVLLAVSATRLQVDAGFLKLLPLKHEYMKVFVKYRDTFGGANRIVVALTVKQGDIYTPRFFATLREATDEVFFLPGVDRARVSSLYTPDTRFTEVVEDGIAGGNVIPDAFNNTPEDLAQVRENVLKAGIVGRLVANDFTGAIISAQLLEIDPNTGERLDLVEVSHQLETKLRAKFSDDLVDVHIIGFAKVMGDIADGAARVISFFAIAFVITVLLVSFYTQSIRIALVPLVCSLMAVVWQLGLLPLFGFGIDPMSILVPFLVFAIGVSHGVQMVSAIRAEVFRGSDSEAAARASFRRLLLPGGIALASDTIGFITILLIEIRIIQEMAVTASLGVAVIILTNLLFLPVLASYLKLDDAYRNKLQSRAKRMDPLWRHVSRIAKPGPAAVVIAIGVVLLIVGLLLGRNVRIGDLHAGVPELRPDSTYNQDTRTITERFAIGVDVLSVIVETKAEGCIDYTVMRNIDEFQWHMLNVPGVQSAVSLASIAKIINAGWNEGNPKWRVLSRNEKVLVQSVAYVPTSTGLLNNDCSVMPVYLFTFDHKAETIAGIVEQIKWFRDNQAADGVNFQLAANNVGVMAATNEAVDASQYPILIYVFSAVIVLCLITFRSVVGTLCIVLPLALVSLLAYALMAVLEIGLKVNTLPVVALGVGIGVDYGVYIYSRFQSLLKEGFTISEAYLTTLSISGTGVVFTGITLAIGVATWIFSPLQFQADMGVLLTFMFLVNMLGAILLLPALAAWLLRLPSAKGLRT